MVTHRAIGAVALAVITCGCANGSTSVGSTPAAPTGGSPINISGNWGLATRASTSCASSLPADSRNRSYLNVTITQAAGQATFTVGTPLGALPVLVTFLVGNQISGPFFLVDGIPGSTLHVEGQFTGTATATTIAGTLNGFFTNNTLGGLCAAADHQLTFTKR